MRKLIAAINVTLDEVCDHTAVDADEELHDHYTKLIQNAGLLLYGRVTFQLMEYWKTVLAHPTGTPSMDEFAVAMDRVPKLVFSRTLKEPNWHSARIAAKRLEQEVRELKMEEGRDIFACSPSMIQQLTDLRLVDEYQLCVHPVIAGRGKLLFEHSNPNRLLLELIETRHLSSGAMVLTYIPR
jgi:dihydrofolate reductase